MRMRAAKALSLITRDCRGSPALEFALAGPLVIVMMTGIIEFGMIMFVNLTMENALRDASRVGVTGQTPDDAQRDEYILSVINNRLMDVIDVSQANIDIKAYPTFVDMGKAEYIDANSNGAWDSGEAFSDCNGNGKVDNDRGTQGAGDAGQAVLYHIDYDWPLMTPIIGSLIGAGGKFHVQASLAVRNEPWDTEAANRNPVSCGPL